MAASAKEHYMAIIRSRKFLEKLCDPGRTPRVPSSVRTEARDLLKIFPGEIEIHGYEKNSTTNGVTALKNI